MTKAEAMEETAKRAGAKGAGRRAPLKVRFKRLDPSAERPRRGSADAAAWDLAATGVEYERVGGLWVATVHTGLAVEIPRGWYGDVRARSSVFRKGLALSNGCGVVDSDYRGELMARFYCLDAARGGFEPGERCVQLVVAPCPDVEWEEAGELTATVRGAGGYGSTGR